MSETYRVRSYVRSIATKTSLTATTYFPDRLLTPSNAFCERTLAVIDQPLKAVIISLLSIAVFRANGTKGTTALPYGSREVGYQSSRNTSATLHGHASGSSPAASVSSYSSIARIAARRALR